MAEKPRVFVDGKAKDVRTLTNEELIRELELRMLLIREYLTNRSYRAAIPEGMIRNLVRDFGLLKKEFAERKRVDPKGIAKTLKEMEKTSNKITRDVIAMPPERRAGLKPETKLGERKPIEEMIAETTEMLKGTKLKRPKTIRGIFRRIIRRIRRR